jgi:starch synthase
MKILLASSEVHPYSKTGGLADMVGALSKSLARAGHDVGLVTPLYAGVRARFPELKPDIKFILPLGPREIPGNICTLQSPAGFRVYFVDAPVFFERSGIYQTRGVDYPDNAERFIFFSKAIAHLAQRLETEVVHLHDWQTAFGALFLRHHAKSAGQEKRPAICMTIHNLAYQGLFPSGQYPVTNLPWDYFTTQGVEFYGQMNCLKAGLIFADVLTTVSPRYAREITTPEFGCGLDGLLRHRQNSLFGILNGADYEEWNPAADPNLTEPYTADHLDGKLVNKKELQRELGLAQDPSIPLFGSITRLVEQKGVDIMLGALREMLVEKMQFVLLGSEAPVCEGLFQELARQFPSKMAVRIGFSEDLSHRIEAAADFFLMPSRFEPCGLNQMYSLHYATVPVVRAVGGLDDTVIDVRDNPDKANGIKFHEYSVPALAKAIRKALALFAEPELFHRFRLNAMSADFSWERTANEYIKVYERAIGDERAEAGSS